MHIDPDYFHNKYRIASVRLSGWDYSMPGAYFITICTKGRWPWFGRIVGDRMVLSDVGRVIANYWRMIPVIRPWITLDAWTIMPDHIHGIVIIRARPCDAGKILVGVETRQWRVSTAITSIIENTFDAIQFVMHRGTSECRGVSTVGYINNQKKWKPNTIGSITNQFKMVCTKRIRSMGHDDFMWQPRFYDRIIRDMDALQCIRRYIHVNAVRHGSGHDPISFS